MALPPDLDAAAGYLTPAPRFLPARHISVGAQLVLATAHVLVIATWVGVWRPYTYATRRSP